MSIDRLPRAYRERYERSKLQEHDIVVLCASFGLQREAWDTLLSPEDRRDITEYYVNAQAHLYGQMVPPERADESREQNRQRLLQSFEQTLQDVQHELQQWVSRAQGEDEMDARIEQRVRAFANEFAELIGGNAAAAQKLAHELYAACMNVQQRIARGTISAQADIMQDPVFTSPLQKVREAEVSSLGSSGNNRSHDWIHLLYEQSAEQDVPYFMSEPPSPDQYTRTDLALHELQPTLFFPIQLNSDVPLLNIPVALMRGDYRNEMKMAMRDSISDELPHMRYGSLLLPYAREIQQLLSGVRPREWETAERRREYELFVGYLLAKQAIIKCREMDIPDMSARLTQLHDTFANLTDEQRPPEYQKFSRRVFSEEFSSNRRLFVDEILRKIRAA